MTLHAFVTAHREAIVVRIREKRASRSRPPTSPAGDQDGSPLFLTELGEVFHAQGASPPHNGTPRGSAAGPVNDGLRGFSISQIIEGYFDTREAITELSFEQDARITVEDFHALDRCLDDAVAGVLTSHHTLVA